MVTNSQVKVVHSTNNYSNAQRINCLKQMMTDDSSCHMTIVVMANDGWPLLITSH